MQPSFAPASVAVCWAWAHNFWDMSHGTRGFVDHLATRMAERCDGSSSGSSSFLSGVGSSVSRSWLSSSTSSCVSRGALIRRLRRWSRPTFLDDVIAELDSQTETHGVLIHTGDRGPTQHADKFAAIEYLQELARERRKVQLPNGEAPKTPAVPAVRRKKLKKPTSADSFHLGPDGYRPELALESLDPDMNVLQRVLDAADPKEFIGLDVMVDGERSTIKRHSSEEGFFLVSVRSGEESYLHRIAAAHVAGCLPDWALSLQK